MKISPKTEHFLNRLYDKTENFFSRVDQVMEKLIRGFFWVYLIWVGAFWLIQTGVVFLGIISHNSDLFSPVWLILTSGGLVALYSYLNNEYIGHTHFWKAWFALSIITYFFFGLGVGIVLFVLMFPTIYALYQLGFHDSFHELLCRLKKANIAFLDNEIYKHELKLPAGSDAIYSWELLRFVITRLHIIPPIFKREA